MLSVSSTIIPVKPSSSTNFGLSTVGVVIGPPAACGGQRWVDFDGDSWAVSAMPAPGGVGVRLAGIVRIAGSLCHLGRRWVKAHQAVDPRWRYRGHGLPVVIPRLAVRTPFLLGSAGATLRSHGGIGQRSSTTSRYLR